MGPLSPEFADAIETLVDAQILLVALDFDGTLAPLVDHPDDARPLPASAELLGRLAALENTVTALISGRDLASLRAVANPPTETLLVGSHGTERWAPESFGIDATHIDLNVKQSTALDKATKVLEIGRLRPPRHQRRIQARLGGPACAPGGTGDGFKGHTFGP